MQKIQQLVYFLENLIGDLVKNIAGLSGKDYTNQNRLNRLRNVETDSKIRNNNNANNNLFPPPSPPSIPPGSVPFIPLCLHHLFPHPQSFFTSFQPDLIILLVIFMFQYNFDLKILVAVTRGSVEIHLVHRHRPKPEKKNRKKL